MTTTLSHACACSAIMCCARAISPTVQFQSDHIISKKCLHKLPAVVIVTKCPSVKSSEVLGVIYLVSLEQ